MKSKTLIEIPKKILLRADKKAATVENFHSIALSDTK